MVHQRDKHKERLGFPMQYKKVEGGYELTEVYSYMGLVKPTFTVVHKFYTIHTTGLIVIHVGYRWDGATGIPDNKYNIRASAVHDVYCQAMADKLLPMKRFRYLADYTFTDILIENGMWSYIALGHLLILRAYGLIRYGC